MTKTLTCILCPRGCRITAAEGAEGLVITGNGCPRGKQYAIDESTHPVRTVTSSIRVANRADTMVSVKTAAPVPKEAVFKVMEQIRAAQVQAPVSIGNVLLSDVFGTVVVATNEIN